MNYVCADYIVCDLHRCFFSRIIVNMDIDNFRFCRKCLTRDMITKDEYFKTLKELIENIPQEIKTPADLYEERLKACVECERLVDGMCSACGCYVELRAAKTGNSCPYKMWRA